MLLCFRPSRATSQKPQQDDTWENNGGSEWEWAAADGAPAPAAGPPVVEVLDDEMDDMPPEPIRPRATGVLHTCVCRVLFLCER